MLPAFLDIVVAFALFSRSAINLLMIVTIPHNTASPPICCAQAHYRPHALTPDLIIEKKSPMEEMKNATMGGRAILVRIKENVILGHVRSCIPSKQIKDKMNVFKKTTWP